MIIALGSNTGEVALAKRYKKEPRPTQFWAVMLVMLGVLIAVGTVIEVIIKPTLADVGIGIMVPCIGMVGVGIWGVAVAKKRKQAWNAYLVATRDLWLCKKCGHEWTPQRTPD
jgi:hypothetical protein